MRDSLKYVFSQQVILEDGSVFYYSIYPCDLKNVLGNNVGVLDEHIIIKKGHESGHYNCKLYKTKDGNWYGFEDAKMSSEKATSRLLKSAVDAKGNLKFPVKKLS